MYIDICKDYTAACYINDKQTISDNSNTKQTQPQPTKSAFKQHRCLS